MSLQSKVYSKTQRLSPFTKVNSSESPTIPRKISPGMNKQNNYTKIYVKIIKI